MALTNSVEPLVLLRRRRKTNANEMYSGIDAKGYIVATEVNDED